MRLDRPRTSAARFAVRVAVRKEDCRRFACVEARAVSAAQQGAFPLRE
jgi:hypothetical protein